MENIKNAKETSDEEVKQQISSVNNLRERWEIISKLYEDFKILNEQIEELASKYKLVEMLELSD